MASYESWMRECISLLWKCLAACQSCGDCRLQPEVVCPAQAA